MFIASETYVIIIYSLNPPQMRKHIMLYITYIQAYHR